MTNFSRLTLATLLMGSLALPALALERASPKEVLAASPAAAPRHVRAMKLAQMSAKPAMHKAASTAEIPGSVAKPMQGDKITASPLPARDTAPPKDMKTKEVTKGAIAAPVTKTN